MLARSTIKTNAETIVDRESVTSCTQQLETGTGSVLEGNSMSLEPLFCAFASSAEELDKISEVIASTPWDGDLARAREGRLCVCNMMGVQMISNPASSSGTYTIRHIHSSQYLCPYNLPFMLFKVSVPMTFISCSKIFSYSFLRYPMRLI